MIFALLLLLTLGCLHSEASVDGAPEASCTKWLPFHFVKPRLGYPKYKLSAVQTSDVTFDVTLESRRNGTYIQGFFLQIKHPAYGIEPLGIWDVEAAVDFQARPCPNDAFPPNGITHVGHNPITKVTATWFMDDRLNGTDGLFIKGSVVENFIRVYAVRAPLVEKIVTNSTTTPSP